MLGDGILAAARLAEAVIALRRHLVGADDQRVGKTSGHGAGLGFGKAQGRAGGRFARKRGFVGFRCHGFKRELQAGQKFAAEGRGRGKNDKSRHVSGLKRGG
jgi:hypothetical protein